MGEGELAELSTKAAIDSLIHMGEGELAELSSLGEGFDLSPWLSF